MKYCDFEAAISQDRLRKYVQACSNDTKRAMTLYRYNLKLSQELFVLIGCFEVSLRNKIDKEMRVHYGNDWLRGFIVPGGLFDSDPRVAGTKNIIKKAYDGLFSHHNYSHTKLLAEMEFGVWKYMFNNVQYRLTGRILLNIFPNKPFSTSINQYDNTFVYNELDTINVIRNRIAHHEPICFGSPIAVNLQKVRDCYDCMMRLFLWMNIDSNSLLFGLDHVDSVCRKILNI